MDHRDDSIQRRDDAPGTPEAVAAELVRRALEDSQRYAVAGEPAPKVIHAAPIAADFFRQITGVRGPLRHPLFAVVIRGSFAGSGGVLNAHLDAFSYIFSVFSVFEQTTGGLIFKSISPHDARLRDLLDGPRDPDSSDPPSHLSWP